MAGTDRDDDNLAVMFAAARDAAPDPGPDLMARVLADALAVQSALPVHALTAAPPVSRWRLLVAAIGGWPALGGLAVAGVAGLWIGISPPAALAGLSLAGDVGATGELADYFPTTGLDFAVLDEG